MAAVDATGADGWSGMLTDAVVKCGRDSERKLFMYGISSSRCPKCRARLSSDSNTCGSCQYTHKTTRKCTRCSQKNDPVMWCAECDAYFCAGCHKKPHVLMLGSSKPHHCFAIDGASGKQFVEASWADEFTAMLQATYRLRLRDKMLAEEKAANAKDEKVTAPQQQQSATNGAANSQATPALEPETQPQRPADSASSSNPAPVSAPAVNGVAVAPSTSVSSGPPSAAAAAVQFSSSASPHEQEQSRKRQLPGPDNAHDRNQKAIRPENPSRSAGGTATTPPPDGMSLYDRVKAMHDMRAKAVKTKPPTPQVPLAKMSLQQLLTQQQGDRQRLEREQAERANREADQILQQHREPLRQTDQEQAEQLREKQEKLEREQAENARRLEREQEDKQRQDEVKQRQEKQRRWEEKQRLGRERAKRLRLEKQQQRETHRREEEERKQRQEEKRLREEQRRQDQIRQNEEQQRQEQQREQDAERQRQEEQQRQHREFIQERQRLQCLAEERLRHEQFLRQQADAQALARESNMFISQAQHVLHTQAGYVVSSMPPPSISVSMQQTSSTRITRVPSPVSASPRFQQVSTPPTTQTYPFQAAPGPPLSNGYQSMGDDHSAQTFQVGPPVMESRFETVANEQEESHRLVVRNPNVQHQQSEQQQAEFSAAMVPHGGAGGFSPSKSDEDDELRAVWVGDYDNVNALILQLDSEISKRTEEGHTFVHRSNNITIPDELKLQINNLRAQREQALTKRFESVVRVLIFSEAVRCFAQQNDNIMNDVPAALKASHKKCAELAVDIREFERQAQKLREGIDEAVSSGNPAQMQNVAHLGALIADVERKIRIANAERDKQFIFMFQFSGRLRDMVRAEWAKPARSYN